jgi:hypothetical protein
MGRLRGVDSTILHLDEQLKASYLVAQRFIDGDANAGSVLHAYEGSLESQLLVIRLLPWERERELRRLNNASSDAFERLRLMGKLLAQGDGVEDDVPDRYRYWRWQDREPLQAANAFADRAADARWELAFFEASRRGTMLVLALEAYRLEHGKLPESLDALVAEYFDKLPRDPYSGRDFVYFPQGFPRPRTALEIVDYDETRPPLRLEIPCVWCTSARLLAKEIERPARDEKAPAEAGAEETQGRPSIGIYRSSLAEGSTWAARRMICSSGYCSNALSIARRTHSPASRAGSVKGRPRFI